MEEVFCNVSIECREVVEPRRLLGEELIPGYVYECVDSQSNYGDDFILVGDLILCLSTGGHSKRHTLYNLRNQICYENTAKAIFYKKRSDIAKVKLSIPTTIPF